MAPARPPLPSPPGSTRVFGAAVDEKRVPDIAAIAFKRDDSIIFNNSLGTIDINSPASAPITSSTKMGIASMTKAVTAVAALQLIEQGKLGIDDLVENYILSWKNISVIDGFTDDGQPILHGPKTKATILNLFTHTSSQPYAFLNDNIRRWNAWAANQKGKPLSTPLAADPGIGWFYGGSLDTLGNVVEAMSGQPLDVYFEENIFKPLGIKNSGPIAAYIYSHRRLANGTIASLPTAPVSATATPGSSAFLTHASTIDDYSTFLLTLINWGTHRQTGVTILHSSTVRDYVFTDLIPRAVPGYGTCGFKPAGDLGWTAAFLSNNEDVPERRRAGSGAWAGINNLFYWVNPVSGKLGGVFTNPLPFLDPEILDLFKELENEVYAA